MLKRISSVIVFILAMTVQVFAQTPGQKTHEVMAGETLYSLARANGVTVEDIQKANPSMDILKTGMIIIIPAPKVPAADPTQAAQKKKPNCRTTYTVEKKETVYSICKKFGLNMDEFLAANPQITKEKVKKGEEVCIPFTKAEIEAKRVESEKKEEEQEKIEAEKIHRVKSVKVGVILPFGLQDAKLNAESQRMVEMYEGFLLAVDSLKKGGVNVDVYTFDEKDSNRYIDSLTTSNSIFPYLNIIFGPFRANHISQLSAYASKHDIQLVVPCSSRYGLANNSPNLFQVNTSESYIYDKVYEAFASQYAGSNIIFVAMNETERTDFLNGLKGKLTEKGKGFSNIAFADLDNLSTMLSADQQNVLVPTSSSQNAFEMLCLKLNSMERNKKITTDNITMFGYPLWQTFSTKNQANMNKYRVSYFATFYNNANGWRTVAFTNKFKSYFNRDLIKSHPKFALLGFDSGYYFIKGMWEYGDKFQRHLDGISMKAYQNPLSFQKVNASGGYINKKMIIVSHHTDGSIGTQEF